MISITCASTINTMHLTVHNFMLKLCLLKKNKNKNFKTSASSRTKLALSPRVFPGFAFPCTITYLKFRELIQRSYRPHSLQTIELHEKILVFGRALSLLFAAFSLTTSLCQITTEDCITHTHTKKPNPS